tara:strand:- start:747 stop:1310 length:564 start_codon:yes stop_codon:yes gene_type:complete
MAAKSGKGKQSHSQRLGAAMKSINNNRTPISSILPTQKKTVYKTASSKGDRSKQHSGPNKLLLAVTNPGRKPVAPSPISANTKSQFKSYVPKTGSWNTGAKSYKQDISASNLLDKAYNTRQSEISEYNRRTLPDYVAASEDWTRGTAINRQKVSHHSEDRHKQTNVKSRTSHKTGSRSSSHTGKGSR